MGQPCTHRRCELTPLDFTRHGIGRQLLWNLPRQRINRRQPQAIQITRKHRPSDRLFARHESRCADHNRLRTLPLRIYLRPHRLPHRPKINQHRHVISLTQHDIVRLHIAMNNTLVMHAGQYRKNS